MKKQRLLLMFFSAVLLICCSAALVSAAAISLPATGQTKCYATDSTGAEIPCAGTGQDGDKRAGVAWPNPRFTVSGDCVTDNLTGLVWAKNANLPNGRVTWQGALDYVKSLNAGGGLCGQTDWRLPNVLELESLSHVGFNEETCGASKCGTNADWLNTQGFINVNVQNLSGGYFYYYWSSTSMGLNAFLVSLYNGHWTTYSTTPSSSTNNYVWPVRGGQSTAPARVWKTGQTKCYDTSGAAIACAGTGQDGEYQKGVAWPTPRFTDNIDGTVTDNLTGLIWLKDSIGCFSVWSWKDALTGANTLANGRCGLSDRSQAGDWRLPNKKELLSLLDITQYPTALPAGNPFKVDPAGHWSSSTYTPWTDHVWGVYFDNSLYTDYTFKDSGHYVWPVRGGQSGSSCNLSISPASQSFTSTGGTGSVTVTASGSSCAWTASSTLSWVTITSGSGTGSGTATFTVSANTSGAGQRTGNITIAGQTFVITQSDTAFADVLSTNVFYNYINAIYNAHITVGCSQNPLMYCPDTGVTRGQMAAFIIRAKYGENFTYTQTPYFSDVPATNVFFKYVQRLRDDAITVVTGTYGVNDIVTRGQMAAFIIRAKYGENFTYTQTPYFSDVPATNAFFKYVQKLKDTGITTVTGTYYVDAVVTRGQMAAFISRAFLGMP